MTYDRQPTEVISACLSDSIAVKQAMLADHEVVSTIERVAGALVEAFRSARKVLLCGNGGSAADAQHIAAELVGRFLTDRDPLPAISLAVNISTVTALGNDFSFAEIFARQVRALGNSGDVLLVFSTSGNSENVLRAVQAAKERAMTTVTLTGSTGGKLLEASDICLRIPSDNSARVQEGHITAAHIICELVESALV
jgi:D-sedoheptulose 7-phosphate isomerase